MDPATLHKTLKKTYTKRKKIPKNKREKTWRCDICNQYYTRENKLYHFNTTKHMNNLKKYNIL